MNPGDFTKFPFDSIFHNNESEVVAQNIMVILWRTGNYFRKLSWEEYCDERLKDEGFNGMLERPLFDKVSKYCESEEVARKFSKEWRDVQS